ncbi:MAG: ATP-binding protein [DPANN group archaeon]|nr:ATP-binding protein [DPANN group archaeon]
MDKNNLRQLIIDQQDSFKKKEDLIQRDLDLTKYLLGNEIIVISGIRRCGKSSLLKIISLKTSGISLFLNFDDIRFIDFSTENFNDIEDIVHELYGNKENITYFLDEIQNVLYWERWVNNLNAKCIKVYISGSNSSLLSSEISTYLTGRNKVIKLHPFSFKEYLALKKITDLNLSTVTSQKKVEIYGFFNEYLEKGGFPLVLKNNDIDLSGQYFEDILNKDVLNRYRIKEVKELKDMVLFLISNVGKIYSYSALKEVTGIKSLSTIKNYIDYLKNVFLIYSIARFDYSIKKQKVSSSKIYSGDNSFLKTISFNFSLNTDRKLENLVFLELLRKNYEIYYHLNKKECDFIVKEGIKITKAIQVSSDISNHLTKKREIDGLLEAMSKYKLNEGLILTSENEETIILENKKIIIKPIWKWMLE